MPIIGTSTFRRKHPFCQISANLTPDLHFPKKLTAVQDFWVRARIHPNNSVILSSPASLWSRPTSTFSKFCFVWVTPLTGFPILQNVSSISKLDEQRRGEKTFNIKWEPRNIWKIQLIKNLFRWRLSDLGKKDKMKLQTKRIYPEIWTAIQWSKILAWFWRENETIYKRHKI